MCNMSELTKKVQETIIHRSHDKTVLMLKEAKIIDNEGYLHKDYFSNDEVTESRNCNPIV